MNTQAKYEHEYCDYNKGCPTAVEINQYLRTEFRHERFEGVSRIKAGAGIFAALFNTQLELSSTQMFFDVGERAIRMYCHRGELFVFLDHESDTWSLEPWV